MESLYRASHVGGVQRDTDNIADTSLLSFVAPAPARSSTSAPSSQSTSLFRPLFTEETVKPEEEEEEDNDEGNPRMNPTFLPNPGVPPPLPFVPPVSARARPSVPHDPRAMLSEAGEEAERTTLLDAQAITLVAGVR